MGSPWEHQDTQCQCGPMARVALNQDKVSVPLLMRHRDQRLCSCGSGQHLFLLTHLTCMNVSSFSLTRGLAERLGNHFLGKPRHEANQDHPLTKSPAELGACSWPGMAFPYGIWHLEQCQGQPGCSCTRSTQMVHVAPSFAAGEDPSFHGSWPSFSRRSDIHQK